MNLKNIIQVNFIMYYMSMIIAFFSNVTDNYNNTIDNLNIFLNQTLLDKYYYNDQGIAI